MATLTGGDGTNGEEEHETGRPRIASDLGDRVNLPEGFVRRVPWEQPRNGDAPRDDATVGVRDWVAEQLRCHPDELRQMRTIELAPGVREFRYLRGGQSAVVATVARQQPGRYRLRASWQGGSAEASVRGSVSA